MRTHIIRKMIGAVLLGIIIAFGFSNPVQLFLSIPDEIVLFEGDQTDISSVMATASTVKNPDVVSVNQKSDQITVKGESSGSDILDFTVGTFPIKKVGVKVLPDFKVIPGGQSIGVKLNTRGVLVVGHHLIHTTKGERSPGEVADIQVGDIITKINGQSVQKMSDIGTIVKKIGQEGHALEVTIVRENKELNKKLVPVKDKSDSTYRIGLYIRDSAAGVGTLTFFHPDSKKYGALGHVISDMDTKKPIVVHHGEIYSSSVTSIEKGSNGHPGEKLARFSNTDHKLGTITRNSPFGIFGEMNNEVKNGMYDKPMPIALSHQVKEGPAKILTVVKGSEVKAYDVEVVSSIPQKFPATKGMVIKVTDPELLKETGGIVQGMSGSPIIQDGKVIGAVTHVFVNDSTSGYGVHIEWMLEEAGINIYKENRNGQRTAS
ncbi:SpoIVB peptidase [Guptibacillus algicola]|uniref:SpoIVB peptidase n=1 Tax=Guptibacillus algicola TaxID=225844 RepID=UPI001CD5E996|nr:SpoIVB peptidase [Alkalihalobacillus algicola]MCA0985962.1 SpoIVB peptidase [Alkalihalobacillus algicola]